MTIGKTKLVKVDLVVGENTGEVTIQNTVSLSRPAIKIFRIDAKLVDVTATVTSGQVLIEGTIHKQIFFVGEDDKIYHQAEDVPFSHFVFVNGCVSGRNQVAHVRGQIEKLHWDLSDALHLHQKIIVLFFVKVTEPVQLNVFLSAVGPLLKTDVVVGENTVVISPVQEVVLERPAIKVREIRCDIRDVEAECLDDHVAVRGVLHCQIFFIGEDNIAYHQATDVPFSAVVDVPGCEPGMHLDINFSIAKVEKIVLINGLKIQVRSIVQIFVKVTEDAQVCVETFPTGPLVRTFKVIAERIQQALFENQVELPMPALKVQDIEAKLSNLKCEVLHNKVVITGVIHKQIFFVGEDDILHHHPEDVPFSTIVEVPGAHPGHQCFVHGRVDHVHWLLHNNDNDLLVHDHNTTVLVRGRREDLNFEKLRQRIVVEFFVKVTEECQLNIRAVERFGALPAFGQPQLVAAITPTVAGAVPGVVPGVAPTIVPTAGIANPTTVTGVVPPVTGAGGVV